MHGTLTPAYGRDYETEEQALRAWNEGKDFILNTPVGSGYCSIRDTETLPVGHTLQIRWRKREMVDVITKQPDGSYAGTGMVEDQEEIE